MLGSLNFFCEPSILVLKSIQMISIIFPHINKTRNLVLNSFFKKKFNFNYSGKNQTRF